VLLHGREVDDGVDPVRLHPEVEREVDIVGAERVDERVNLTAGRGPDAIGHPFAVLNGDDALPGEPVVVRLAGQANHLGSGVPGQLYGDRPDPAGGTGDNHRVARVERYRPDRRVGRGADDVEGAGRLPRDVARAVGQRAGLDHNELGLARPIVGEAQNLVTHAESRHAGAEFDHHPGEITALSGWERGGPSLREHPLPDADLARVDRRRLHLDQDLSRTGDRPLHLRDP
jgi:hypothetical protein